MLLPASRKISFCLAGVLFLFLHVCFIWLFLKRHATSAFSPSSISRAVSTLSAVESSQFLLPVLADLLLYIHIFKIFKGFQKVLKGRK